MVSLSWAIFDYEKVQKGFKLGKLQAEHFRFNGSVSLVNFARPLLQHRPLEGAKSIGTGGSHNWQSLEAGHREGQR